LCAGNLRFRKLPVYPQANNPFALLMELIKTTLMKNKKRNEDAARDSDRESQNIDQGICFLSDYVAQGNGNETSEHLERGL
jgi:hypothetical protein